MSKIILANSGKDIDVIDALKLAGAVELLRKTLLSTYGHVVNETVGGRIINGNKAAGHSAAVFGSQGDLMQFFISGFGITWPSNWDEQQSVVDSYNKWTSYEDGDSANVKDVVTKYQVVGGKGACSKIYIIDSTNETGWDKLDGEPVIVHTIVTKGVRGTRSFGYEWTLTQVPAIYLAMAPANDAPDHINATVTALFNVTKSTPDGQTTSEGNVCGELTPWKY